MSGGWNRLDGIGCFFAGIIGDMLFRDAMQIGKFNVPQYAEDVSRMSSAGCVPCGMHDP